MTIKILLYWFFIGILPLNPFSKLYAQVSNTYTEPSALPKEQTVYSPQVAEMIRYDHTSIQLNTGCIDLNIPLTEWNDPDFDFPISLFYDSSGFRPRNNDNYVGRNWMLNIGGVIYRKVNGIPDDMINYPEPIDQEKRIDGFMKVLGKNYFNLKQMEESFADNPYQYTRQRDLECSEPTLVLNGTSSNIESSADVFYFSFGKHSGKFMINYNGTVSACGNNGCKYEVDLRDMQMIYHQESINTQIHIKTDDGYVYTFGGEGYSSLEYNITCEGSFDTQLAESFKNPHVITAFHLTKITAPNGRTLDIKYKNTNPEYHADPAKLRSLTGLGKNVDKNILMQYIFSGRSVFQHYRAFPLNVEKEEVTKANKKLYTLTKTAQIDYVTTGRMQLYFHYSPRSMNAYSDDLNSSRFPYTCGTMLDKIEIYSLGIKKSVSFIYNYQAGGRMFLDQVTTNDGTYAFKYNTPNMLFYPTPMTSNIDHWGFWRGVNENKGIIPSMEMLDPYSWDYHEYSIASNDRDATGDNFDCTLLSEIHYPTGGRAVFKYEPNRYSCTPHPSKGSWYYPGGVAPIEGVALTGGARIYSIMHYNNIGGPIKKSIFTYGSEKQQGELTYMPYYKYIRTIVAEKTVFKVDGMALDSEGITDLPYPSAHIRYPRVTEHFVSPYAQYLSGKWPQKVTLFAERLIPDLGYYLGDYAFPTYEKKYNALRPETYFPTYTLQIYNSNILAHPSLDITLQQGKIERELFYNSEGTLMKEHYYHYSFHNKDKYALRTYMPSLHFGMRTGLYSHLVKEPLFEYLLDKKEVISYPNNNGTICLKEDVEFFKYDKNGMIAEQGIIKSNGDSIVTNYSRQEFQVLRGFQILPVSKTLSLRNEDAELILQTDTTVYDICKSTIFNDYSWKPSEFCSYATDGQLISRHHYSAYDSYGNLLSETSLDGKQQVYIWGNTGKYLFARIENVTVEEVERALDHTLDYYSKYSENSSDLDVLRHLLSNAHVTTYAYTGARLTRATTTDDQSTFYVYDQKERLTEIYRMSEKGTKEILQLHDYHIVNE